MGRRPSKNTNLPKGMRARIRERKSGKLITYYYYDTGAKPRKEIPLGTDYFIAVQEWAKIASSKIPNQAVATFSVAANAYLSEIISSKGENTRIGAHKAVKFLMQFFGNPDAPLDEIEPKHVSQYLAWRKHAPPSANNEVTYLSAIFNFAREKGYTKAENPCRGVKKYPKNNRSVYIEDHIYKAVYDVASQDVKDLMDIAYVTGQRPIDVVKIHTSHIHDGILHVTQQKTNAKLRFEISGKLKEIINRRSPETGGFLFLNKQGKPLTRKVLSSWFYDLRLQVISIHPELKDEVKSFQFRDLRAKSGTDIYLKSDKLSAKEQLGHASERMTNVYIRKGKVLKPLEIIAEHFLLLRKTQMPKQE